MRQLFALSEAYPDLKANANFMALQGELSKIEDNIANSRRYYNAVVRDFNTKQQTFPNSLVAGTFGFASRRFFEALDAAPDIAQAALHDLDASGPMEMLDDSDLIVEDEDEAELDESDLIQT